jgi:hypothetical protein
MPTTNMKWSNTDHGNRCYARGRGGYRSIYMRGIIKMMQHKIGEIHAADIEKGEIMCQELNTDWDNRRSKDDRYRSGKCWNKCERVTIRNTLWGLWNFSVLQSPK